MIEFPSFVYICMLLVIEGMYYRRCKHLKIVCLNQMHLQLILLTGLELLTIFPNAHINNLWLILKEGEVCKTSCTIVDDAQMTCNPYYRKNRKLNSNACSRLFIPR